MSTKKDAVRPFGLGTFFVVDGTGREQHGTAAGGAIKAPVGRLKVQRSFVIIKLKEGGHNDFAIFCHSIRYGQ